MLVESIPCPFSHFALFNFFFSDGEEGAEDGVRREAEDLGPGEEGAERDKGFGDSVTPGWSGLSV